MTLIKKIKLDDHVKQNSWSKYFNLNDYKRKGYSFNHQISTNGYCVSLIFVKNTFIQKQVQKKSNFAKSHAENREAKDKMEKEEYKIWHDDKMKNTIEKNEKFKLDKKVKKEAFKKTVKNQLQRKRLVNLIIGQNFHTLIKWSIYRKNSKINLIKERLSYVILVNEVFYT